MTKCEKQKSGDRSQNDKEVELVKFVELVLLVRKIRDTSLFLRSPKQEVRFCALLFLG